MLRFRAIKKKRQGAEEPDVHAEAQGSFRGGLLPVETGNLLKTLQGPFLPVQKEFHAFEDTGMHGILLVKLALPGDDFTHFGEFSRPEQNGGVNGVRGVIGLLQLSVHPGCHCRSKSRVQGIIVIKGNGHVFEKHGLKVRSKTGIPVPVNIRILNMGNARLQEKRITAALPVYFGTVLIEGRNLGQAACHRVHPAYAFCTEISQKDRSFRRISRFL